jgi:mono/diheme cytochrome c family protein
MKPRSMNLLATTLLAAVAALGTAACQPGFYVPYGNEEEQGGEDGGTDEIDNAAAKAQFEAEVKGLIEVQCAACHAGASPANGPDFLGPSMDSAYAALKNDVRMLGGSPEEALLVIKGPHAGPACASRTDPGGSFCLTEENEAVISWLAAEAAGDETPPADAGPGQGTLPKTLTEAFARFGDCMSFEDWQTTGMSDLPQQTTSQGTCISCHSEGLSAAFLAADPALTFERTRTTPYLLKFVTGTVRSDGSFNDLVPANRYRDKSLETTHPTYVLSEARETAMQSFFDLTYAKYKEGPCTP